ncbi:MAG: hypothetical protein J0H57_25310, partial [Rhodospirillales bacterium]|nr:hypothetical protein [Rhodospirillales bacterium]
MACCLFGTQLNCLYSELGLVSGAIIEDGTRAVGEWIQASENGAKCGRGNFSIALSDSGDSFTGYYTCKNGTHREPWNERQFESFATPTEVQCGALQDPLNPVTINGRWGDGVTELQDVCIYSSDLRAEVSYQFNQLRSPGYLKAFAYLNQRVLNGRFHENYNQGVELLFAARNGSLGRIYWSTYPAQPVNIHDITDPGRHRYYYISKSPNVNQTANPALSKAHETVKVVVVADPADCSFQFNPVGTANFSNSCDVAKSALARASVTYTQEDAPPGTPASVRIGDRTVQSVDTARAGADSKTQLAAFNKGLNEALTAVGYPAAANPSVVKMTAPWDVFRAQPLLLVIILTYLVILVTMVYGPIAAALVELFPTRIRYTSMSLPYHIGNGWFGGLLPATVFAMNAQSGSIYFGLWYPIVIA